MTTTDNVNDIFALTPVIDGYLMVISASQTDTAKLQRAWRKMGQVGAPILGCIFNRVKSSGNIDG